MVLFLEMGGVVLLFFIVIFLIIYQMANLYLERGLAFTKIDDHFGIIKYQFQHFLIVNLSF